jgi:hypothetical protein
MTQESHSTPTLHIRLDPSPFMQLITSEAVGIPRNETTHYIGFMPPLRQTRIEVSAMPSQEPTA